MTPQKGLCEAADWTEQTMRIRLIKGADDKRFSLRGIGPGDRVVVMSEEEYKKLSLDANGGASYYSMARRIIAARAMPMDPTTNAMCGGPVSEVGLFGLICDKCRDKFVATGSLKEACDECKIKIEGAKR